MSVPPCGSSAPKPSSKPPSKIPKSKTSSKKKKLSISESSLIAEFSENGVNERSRFIYDGRNVQFLEFCLLNYKHVVCPSVRESFISSFKLDKKNGVRSNNYNSSFRKKCLDSLNCIATKGCPLNLKDVNCELVSHFMASRRNSSGKLLSKSSYETSRSAIVHLFRCANVIIPEEFRKKIGPLMAGIKRTVVKKRQEQGLKLNEGKCSMSFHVYEKICELLIASDNCDANFLHCF